MGNHICGMLGNALIGDHDRMPASMRCCRTEHDSRGPLDKRKHCFTYVKMGNDNDARRVALSLLAKGEITLAEATKLAGVSRQLMHYWAQGIQWERVRMAKLTKAWRKETGRGAKLVETEKPRSR